MAKHYYLLPLAIISASIFWFIGAFIQLNVIPFTIYSLKISDIFGGYLFLYTALGIGLGSFFSGFLSGKNVELGISILGILGISIMLILVAIYANTYHRAIYLFIALGFFGGWFIVPLDAYIQYESPSTDRGFIIAAANLLSFMGILLSSLVLWVFKYWFFFKPYQGFIAIGVFSLLAAVILTSICKNNLLRLFCSLYIRLRYNISYSEELASYCQSHTIFYARNYTKTHLYLLFAILPNYLFIVLSDKKPKYAWILTHLGVIFTPDAGIITLKQKDIRPICVFLPKEQPCQQGSLELHFSITKYPLKKNKALLAHQFT